MRLAIISDTHGLLRPEALPHLQGADAIIHAGDVGKQTVLQEITSIAPTYAVKGNVDKGELARELPESRTLQFLGAPLHVLHNLAELDLGALETVPRLVVFGHSHKPAHYTKAGIAYLNPGSIGPRRFKLPVTLAIVTWSRSDYSCEFITL